MSHPYFFTGPDCIISGDKVIIKGRDLNHLANVLRARKGEFIEVSDNERYRYKTSILSISRNEALLAIEYKTVIEKKVPELALFLSILKRNAMELAIQKTTEIGIDKIVPVYTRRAVMGKTDLEKIEEKVSRWQKIAEEASRQCKRDFIPEILKPLWINEINVSEYDIFYLLCEREKDGNNSTLNHSGAKTGARKRKIAYIIGPEGGFEWEEILLLESKGCLRINLGENILRSETASIYFLSVLDFIVRKEMNLTI
ncbi:MAG: 16S rRNA (uracil(1498)-N(3))-methyltransferase [Actinobacteria bacterium]|nr:16S rRNA (uracil(1498)-N(3))-methyltransferase [Actinomycetota bacterium]